MLCSQVYNSDFPIIIRNLFLCTKLQENKKAKCNDRVVKILYKSFKGGNGTEFAPKKGFACQVGAFEHE